VDGDVSGRDLHIDASTIFGTTAGETLHASNSILLGKVTARRRQEGCVRFSFLPFDSESPRRYRCQPESAAQAVRVRPRFESVTYGEPAYAQLARASAADIASGADDEGEMGAWHFAQAPRRLRGLRLALDEYLRFGLEAGVFIVPQQPKRAAVAVRDRPASERGRARARERPRTSRPRQAAGPAAEPAGTAKDKPAAARKKQAARKRQTAARKSRRRT
jgi:hypothetical protein